jgi:hypothetical protein
MCLYLTSYQPVSGSPIDRLVVGMTESGVAAELIGTPASHRRAAFTSQILLEMQSSSHDHRGVTGWLTCVTLRFLQLLARSVHWYACGNDTQRSLFR